MATITANELKTKGITAVDSALKAEPTVQITVRGSAKYVVMRCEHYNKLREQELDLAIRESRAEFERGDYVIESVEEHMRRVLE